MVKKVKDDKELEKVEGKKYNLKKEAELLKLPIHKNNDTCSEKSDYDIQKEKYLHERKHTTARKILDSQSTSRTRPITGNRPGTHMNQVNEESHSHMHL